VISIAQQDVGPGGAHAIGQHRLDGGGGADRHEGRRSDLAPRRVDGTRAGLAVGGVEREGETVCHGARFTASSRQGEAV